MLLGLRVGIDRGRGAGVVVDYSDTLFMASIQPLQMDNIAADVALGICSGDNKAAILFLSHLSLAALAHIKTDLESDPWNWNSKLFCASLN